METTTYDIEKIKAIPVDEIITRETGLKLNKHNYLEQCPFCGSGTGKNKSSAFHLHKQTFKCLSCDAKGSNIEFIMKLRNKDTGEAIRYIGENYNIEGNVNIIPVAPVYKEPEPTTYLPSDLYSRYVTGETNNLINYLVTLFGSDIVSDLIDKYQIGTSNGYVVFIQTDTIGRNRQVKAMLYDTNGKRDRVNKWATQFWGKKISGINDPNLQQCFFGEHLLTKYPKKDVAIVESEKTAIIASVYIPDFIWLATGGKSGCSWTSNRVFVALFERKVRLFPDLGAFDEWSKYATDLAAIADITVDNLLEKIATDEQREKGLDIADYLITFPVQELNATPQTKDCALSALSTLSEPKVDLNASTPNLIEEVVRTESADSAHLYDIPVIETERPFFTEASNFATPEYSQEISRNRVYTPWDISEIESFFETVVLPETLRINNYTLCGSVKKMVETNLGTVIRQNGNPTYKPYLDRLIELKEILVINMPNGMP